MYSTELKCLSHSLPPSHSPAIGVDQSNYRVAKLIQCPGAGGSATSHQHCRQSLPDCFHSGRRVSFIMAIGVNPTSKALVGPPVTIVPFLWSGQCLLVLHSHPLLPLPTPPLCLWSRWDLEKKRGRLREGEKERETEREREIQKKRESLGNPQMFFFKCKCNSTTKC